MHVSGNLTTAHYYEITTTSTITTATVIITAAITITTEVGIA
jgi:hypothetical protein